MCRRPHRNSQRPGTKYGIRGFQHKLVFRCFGQPLVLSETVGSQHSPFVQKLDRYALSTFGTTRINDLSPVLGRHALAESMSPFSRYITGLKCSFHVFLRPSNRERSYILVLGDLVSIEFMRSDSRTLRNFPHRFSLAATMVSHQHFLFAACAAILSSRPNGKEKGKVLVVVVGKRIRVCKSFKLHKPLEDGTASNKWINQC